MQLELGFPLRDSAHHVVELLAHHVPTTFRLPGASHATIGLGPGDEPGAPDFALVLGGASLRVADFDVAGYRDADAEHRQHLLLDALEAGLAAVTDRLGATAVPVHDAAAATRADGFRAEIVTKSSRSTPDRRRRFEVVRLLGLDTGEAWVVRVRESAAGTVIAELPLTSNPGYLDRREVFARSAWAVDDLVLTGRLGEETARIHSRSLAVSVPDWLTAPGIRYDRAPFREEFLRQCIARAVSSAGHARKAHDHAAVIRFLAPYDEHLAPRHREWLDEARAASQ